MRRHLRHTVLFVRAQRNRTSEECNAPYVVYILYVMCACVCVMVDMAKLRGRGDCEGQLKEVLDRRGGLCVW